MTFLLWTLPVYLYAIDFSFITTTISKNKVDAKKFGIVVFDEQEEIYSLHGGDAFKPASLSKIVTAAAALELLGPQYNFRTQLLFDGNIAENELRGSVYLRGGGDPSFHSGKLAPLLQALTNQKIKVIEGDLIIDDSRFQTVRNADWKKQLASINPNQHPLFVNLDPPEDVNPFSKEWVKIERLHRRVIDIAGKFVVYQDMTEPDLWTGYHLAEQLKKKGIKLKGEVKRGSTSDSARLLTEIKTPITRIVSHMLKTSNNYYADMLVRNIPVAYGERPGTFASGIQFLTFYLDHVKIPESRYFLNSGSGFSHENRFSPRAFAKLLNYLKNEQAISTHFFSSLS